MMKATARARIGARGAMLLMVQRALEKRSRRAKRAAEEREAILVEEERRRRAARVAGRAWADMTARYWHAVEAGSAWPFPAAVQPPSGFSHAYRVFTWTPELVAIAHDAARARWDEMASQARAA